MRWYRKAAEQGHAEAQYSLGLSYSNGEDVITDEREAYIEAYIWYSIAKASGHENAANKLRGTNWSNYLSKAEIRSARQEAQWRLEAIENR